MKKNNYIDREIACLVAYLEKAPAFLKEKVRCLKFTDYEVSRVEYLPPRPLST